MCFQHNNQPATFVGKRGCPICMSDSSKMLFILEYAFPENYSIDHKQKIVSCDVCGFVFNIGNNRLDVHAVECNRYEGVSVGFYGCALEHITKNFEKDTKILDVGCGRGFLLLELKKQGYTNLFGLDPSKACVENMEEPIIGKQGSVYDKINEFENYFDVIILTNVIEHLEYPSQALYNISSWLESGGGIYGLGVKSISQKIIFDKFKTI